MTSPTVRPEVVSVLLVTDFSRVPQQWQRMNGQPLTATERHLAQNANESEQLAARNLSKQALAHINEQLAAWTRLNDLAHAYNLPGGTDIDEIAHLFTTEEKAEYDRLRELVAPCGIVIIPDPKMIV